MIWFISIFIFIHTIIDHEKYKFAANTQFYYHPLDSSKAGIKMQREYKVINLINFYISENIAAKVFNAQAMSYKLSLVSRVNKAILIREIIHIKIYSTLLFK